MGDYKKMTVEERNDLIDDAIVAYKGCHDKYFPIGRSLSHAEWQNLRDEMDAIAYKYKKTSIAELSGTLCMAFLDDIAFVHKKWIEKGK